MNTPAHVALNLGLLGRKQSAWVIAPILAGSLAPDLPMLIFYASEKLRAVPEALIWSEHYFLPQWQLFFDLPNSLPLVACAAGLAMWAKSRGWLLFFLAMALHIALDFPLHHDDAHRHFWPLSDWKFFSPVSYWDPAHFGRVVLCSELALSTFSLALCWQRWPRPAARAVVGGCALVYLGFGVFATIMWGGG